MVSCHIALEHEGLTWPCSAEAKLVIFREVPWSLGVNWSFCVSLSRILSYTFCLKFKRSSPGDVKIKMFYNLNWAISRIKLAISSHLL